MDFDKIDKQELFAGLKKEIKNLCFIPSAGMAEGNIAIVGDIRTLRHLGYEDSDGLFSKSHEEKERVRKKESTIMKEEKGKK